MSNVRDASESLVPFDAISTVFLCLMYGLIERKPEIYLGNGLSMVLNGLMVVGITIHAGVTF